MSIWKRLMGIEEFGEYTNDAPLVFGLSIAAVAVIAIIAIRLLLKRKSKELSRWIEAIVPYHNTRIAREDISRQNNERIFADIETDLERCFRGKIISYREEELFANYYKKGFQDVHCLLKQLKRFGIKPSENIAKFAHDFENIRILKN